MKRLRTIVFWAHLAAGLSAGVVIFIMSVTGALLAFQPQILKVIERDARRVEPPAPGAKRMSIEAIVKAATDAKPNAQPTGVTLESDPTVSALVALGPAGNLWINPYTGAVLGTGSARARGVFRALTDWHRYIAISGENRPTGRAITGASNLAFLALAISGVYLWWPRKWTGTRLRTVTVFDWKARGKARNFNWHNVIGFWSSAVLIILTASGAVISYPWASNLVYRIAGSTPPSGPGGGGGARPEGAAAAGSPRAQGGGERRGRGGAAPAGEPRAREGQGPGRGNGDASTESTLPPNVDQVWSRAEELMPTWGSIALRLPPRPGGPISFTITDATHWNQFARSQLTVDAATANVVRWEPYAASSAGQKARGWMRFAHTGELGGVIGQFVAGLACVGGAFLVWTGFSLAFRRFLAWRSRTAGRVTARAA